MKSVRTEGCHMGPFRKFLGTACCTYWQSNMTNHSDHFHISLTSLNCTYKISRVTHAIPFYGYDIIHTEWRAEHTGHFALYHIRNNHDTTDVLVTVDDMICSIKEFPNNKSPGYDGLMSEHFKYASHRLYVLMTIIIQFMIKHGFLPQQFMTTMLVLILKNKNGDIASKSNHRPIALSTDASKSLVITVVNRGVEYILTTESQFAFKRCHSTDMCILTLKRCIRYYAVHNIPCMYAFLMLAKHLIASITGIFFKVFIDRKCYAYVIKLLVYWYQEQRLRVKWDGMTSDNFYGKSNML